MADRKQAQLLLTSTQYERFKALQLRLSTEKRMGRPQPAKGAEIIEAMLNALETKLDQPAGE